MSNENNRKCKNIINCSAPLCPEQNLDIGIWYPSEGICKRKCHASIKWINKQKKIKKKTIHRDRYFTCEALEQIKRITAKTKGKNPNKDIHQYPTQNTPEFNEKTLAKVGVSDTIVPLTSNPITDDQNLVKTRIRQG